MKKFRAIAWSSLLFLFSHAVECKSLSTIQERVVGEAIYQMCATDDRSTELMANYFSYEMNRVCDLGHVELDYPLDVTVLKSPAINAFATSGSFVFIYTGLMERLTDISEIMGVLCHELTHTWEHHIRRQVDQQNDMNTQKTLLLATLPLIVLFPGAGELIYGMAIDQTVMKQLSFSQQMEYEADAGALKLLMLSGFDSDKLTTAFESIGRYQSLDGAPNYMSYYATHPLTRSRIDRIKYHKKNNGFSPINEDYVARAQWDYSLLLADLEMDYEINTAIIGDRKDLNEYKDCVAKNDYQKMFERHPDSLVLRMRVWNSLRSQGKWSELTALDKKFANDKYWSGLKIVIEGRAERDFSTLSSRDFIRKYQKCLLESQTLPGVMKYLAKAYYENNQPSFYHLAQAKYFLLLGEYQAALKELRSSEVDQEALYTRELKQEAELKLNVYREMG